MSGNQNNPLSMRSLRLSGLITKARTKTMSDIYEDLGHLMGDLEFGESLLETMVLNGKNEKANICLNEKLFVKLPRVYCNECESYEIPYCANCGEPLTYNRKGELECSCDAPLKITCAEQHSSCEIRPWFIPQKRLDDMLKRNIQSIFKDNDLDYQMCVMGDELYIVHSIEQDNQVEIQFSDISCFKHDAIVDPSIRSFAVRMNEKCDGICSKKKIDKCVCDPSMVCLPKVFFGVIPSFRPQPHMGGEYGDVSGQVQDSRQNYEMIGIIKKNSKNNQRGSKKTDEELIQTYLLPTSVASHSFL